MAKGYIFSYNPIKDYGFVRDWMDQRDFFFHTRDLRFPKEEITPQMPVIFDKKFVKNSERVIATNIEKCF